MPEQFILIPGRTSTQGTTLNEGKSSEGYLAEINTLRLAPQDMQRLGLTDGDQVRVWNDVGEVIVPVAAAKGDELPPGVLFISYGDKSSRLMGGETHGSGMPDSKGIDVWVERVESGESRAES
jgi:formylmethanofuran dehydrogenase subunit D